MDLVPKYGPEEIDLASIVDRLTAVESKIFRTSMIEVHLNLAGTLAPTVRYRRRSWPV